MKIGFIGLGNSETDVPQYDPVARKAYVNLQGRNTVAVIDPATDTAATRYPVSGCRVNHGARPGASPGVSLL